LGDDRNPEIDNHMQLRVLCTQAEAVAISIGKGNTETVLEEVSIMMMTRAILKADFWSVEGVGKKRVKAYIDNVR
jgi:hypothetical protein